VKLRVGFVSNSSSSSFIVAFPSGFKPTLTSVQAYLFGDRNPTFRTANGGRRLTAARASELIYDQMRGARPNDQKRLLAALGDGLPLPGEPKWSKFGLDSKWTATDEKTLKAAWKAWTDAVKAHKRDYLSRHAPKLPGGADLYAFTFWDTGDEDPAMLMYGYGFRGVPHLRSGRKDPAS
jgi:hypothetical protein